MYLINNYIIFFLIINVFNEKIYKDFNKYKINKFLIKKLLIKLKIYF